MHVGPGTTVVPARARVDRYDVFTPRPTESSLYYNSLLACLLVPQTCVCLLNNLEFNKGIVMSSTSLPVKESAVDDLEKNADDSVRSIGSVKQSEDVANEPQGKDEAPKPPSGPPGHGQGGGPPGGHGKGRGGLPPNHPMHPSQFSGDRYDRRAMMTLLGSFCVMVWHQFFRFCVY